MSASAVLLTGCEQRAGLAIEQVCREWRSSIVKPSEADTAETIIGIDREWAVHDATCPERK